MDIDDFVIEMIAKQFSILYWKLFQKSNLILAISGVSKTFKNVYPKVQKRKKKSLIFALVTTYSK